MIAVVAGSQGPRRDLIAGEIGRHRAEVLVADRLSELLGTLGREQPPDLVVLVDELETGDILAAGRAIRDAPSLPGAEDPVLVVVTSTLVDTEAALAAGVTDLWLLPDAAAAAPADSAIRIALAERYAALQARFLRIGGELTLLRRALDLTGTGFVLSDPRLPDNPIVYANQAFLELTGYALDEVLGRNCRFLQGDGADQAAVGEMRSAIAAGRPATVELRNERRDGSVFVNEVHIAPVRDEQGTIVRFVGVQVDVTDYRHGPERLALERHARERAEAAGRRSRFLADASPRLDATLDQQATLDALGSLAVAQLVDTCVVWRRVGDRARCVAVAAADTSLERALLSVPQSVAFSLLPPALRSAFGTRRPSPPLPSGEQAGLPSDAALGPTTLVPLVARGRTVAVAILARRHGKPPLGGDDLVLADDLARRAALALDNARLYEEQRDIALALATELVPSAPLALQGYDVTTRYRSASDALRIGGDFLDHVRLADGSECLVIGDVTGKGARAAALTGRARATLRTAARYVSGPENLLRALNEDLHGQPLSQRYCTVALLHRPAGAAPGVLGLLLAGHPRAIVIGGGDDARVVGRHGTILGFKDVPQWPLQPLLLRDDETLVLCTDGVISASGARMGDSDLLLPRARAIGAGRLDGIADALFAPVTSRERRDDAALVALRIADPDPDRSGVSARHGGASS